METEAAPSRTAPFDAGAEHRRLARMVGEWKGPTRTWFDPTHDPVESVMHARIDTLLGGRFVRLAYASDVSGKPHAGELTVGYHRDEKSFEAAWIDSFHTGTAMMACKSEASRTGEGGPEAAISLLGSYPAGPERWGWRTEIEQPADDRLILRAFNITPQGEAHLAIETRLQRAG